MRLDHRIVSNGHLHLTPVEHEVWTRSGLGAAITEIELVCVRAGSDKYGNPYFGYLEVTESIATKTSTKFGIDADGNYTEDVPMTASLALYFLLMLAKKVALPGEWTSFMDVGGLGVSDKST